MAGVRIRARVSIVGDVMACDGGVCDCMAVMDDVRPVPVVYTCIMLWQGGQNYT